jgi:DNA repair photolyase
MEPRAASPARRLAAISELTQAGIPTGVLASPMIPGLNDAELETILAEAAKAGASSAGSILLRLPHELGALFTDWLENFLPERAAHVLSLIRASRAGRLNDPTFHGRFTGTGPYADLLTQRFTRAAKQNGLATAMPELALTAFAAPAQKHEVAQMSLF